MKQPFPDIVDVPQGLVRVRTHFGIPTLSLVVLILLGTGPLFLWGKQAWWMVPVTVAIGVYVAKEAHKDPDFLRTWSGELHFKRRYL
jgi:hypothetical protein